MRSLNIVDIDFAFVAVEIAPAHDLDAVLVQHRDEVLERLRMTRHQRAGALTDMLHDLAWGVTAGSANGDASGNASLQSGYAHHVELVEVAGKDGEEPGPLQWWNGGVLSRAQGRVG